MPTQGASGKPTTRRYTDQEKEQAVRLVRQLRAELGTEHGTVRRVAEQLGYGVESVRTWVRQADIDAGAKPGVASAEAERIRQLEQENRELRRANEMATRSNTSLFEQALVPLGFGPPAPLPADYRATLEHAVHMAEKDLGQARTFAAQYGIDVELFSIARTMLHEFMRV